MHKDIEDSAMWGEYAPTFGELLITGWDWGRDDWTAYSIKPEVLEVVRPIINEKIENRFFQRELGVEIPGRWKMLMKSKMEEIMETVGPQYNEISNGVDLSGITYTRSRSVESGFPQSQIEPELGDYASGSVEGGSESFSSSSTLDAIIKFRQAAIAPDAEVIRRVSVMFSNNPLFL